MVAGKPDTDETLAARTRRLLRELDHRPKRSRGQSFLVDPSVADRIADLACDGGEARVLEVGAGLGALTERLAARAQRVLALEVEEAFVRALARLLPCLEVRQADALAFDYGAVTTRCPGQWRACGCLPYYAATAMILRMLETEPPFERIVTTVQREVGDRLLARPGDPEYGGLSVVTHYYADERRAVLRVPRGAFYPQPKVDSSVVLLRPRRSPPAGVHSEELLFAAIRAGFGQRRKQLVNALPAGGMGPLDREGAREALTRARVGERARAEELGLSEFIAVANALWERGVRPDA